MRLLGKEIRISYKPWLVLLGLLLLIVLVWQISFRSGKSGNDKHDMKLPGTQPHTISAFDPPNKCRICHAPAYDTAPYPLWSGSMMSQAARDPLFYAALAVANQDVSDSGDLCLRCHTPQGWLLGRSKPPDGSALMNEDLDGVTCDFCHRLVDPFTKEGKSLVKGRPVTNYGNGMYVVDNKEDKRSPLSDSIPPHRSKYSKFYVKGEFCGTCHDVTNPINKVPIERTYSEWRLSWFAEQGENGNCQACHMQPASGFAAEPKLLKAKVPYRENIATHDLTGGSNWVYDALPLLWDNLDTSALQLGKARATQTLRRGAKLEIDYNKKGELSLTVRIINQTGHKLPTGYPEGRRMWLNVKGFDASDRQIFESGKYDTEKADLIEDKQLKIYQAKPGIKGKGPTFHFLLNDYFAFDNRIPPRGFTNKAFNKAGAGVVGYTYRDGQFWDDTNYKLPLNTNRVRVAILYQSSEKAYIDFLRNENKTNDWGKKITDVWEKTGKGAPVEMTATEINIR